jgi:hypothetical protein
MAAFNSTPRSSASFGLVILVSQQSCISILSLRGTSEGRERRCLSVGKTSQMRTRIGAIKPSEIPLIRPSGTFSPNGGEGWDEGVRFMESAHFTLTRIWTMNQSLDPHIDPRTRNGLDTIAGKPYAMNQSYGVAFYSIGVAFVDGDG